MKKIKVALIGTGIIAHEHAYKYQAIEGVEIVAACDINEKKLNDFCDKWNIKTCYTDYRELLKNDEIEAVDVNLHNNLHLPISLAVMAAGKHCYCEKPMAGSYTDAVKMKEAAKKYGVKLHIQLALLYGGAVECAKKLMNSGRLGEVYHARSYGYRRRGRPYVDGYAEKEFVNDYWAGHGALYDMGVYHISQLLYLLDTPKIKSISGNIYQKLKMDENRKQISGYNVEELGVGLVKFENGLSMDIIESWAIHGGEFPGSSIHGSLGGLQFKDEKTLTFYSEIEGYPAVSTLNVDSENYRIHQLNENAWYNDNSQTHWVGVLRGECKPIDTVEIALQTMLISEGIFLSSKLGKEILADEIPELCKSNAITKQETPFGELHY